VEVESRSRKWKLKVEEVSGCRKLSALSAYAFRLSIKIPLL
jgi:hypothetical protein